MGGANSVRLKSDTKRRWKIPNHGCQHFQAREKLAADPNMRRQFTAVYGSGPDATNNRGRHRKL